MYKVTTVQVSKKWEYDAKKSSFIIIMLRAGLLLYSADSYVKSTCSSVQRESLLSPATCWHVLLKSACVFWHLQTETYHTQRNKKILLFFLTADINTHIPVLFFFIYFFFSHTVLSKKSHNSSRPPDPPQSEKSTDWLRVLSGRQQRSPFHPGSCDRLRLSPAWQSSRTLGPWRTCRDPRRSRSVVCEKKK